MKKTDRHTKIIRTVLLTVSSLIFFIGIISAQTNPVYDKMPKILTPEADAAAIGRYGDYPVDLSTGVPSINIPLYEIDVNGFRLPISISYHASGNKVDDIASTVGLGWVLNAGGAVTRTVNGYQDENNTLFGAKSIP